MKPPSRTRPIGLPRPQQRCCWKRRLSRSFILTVMAIALDDLSMMRWLSLVDVVGNRTGFLILTSGPSSTASPTICC
jgi:hypothetical protein